MRARFRIRADAEHLMVFIPEPEFIGSAGKIVKGLSDDVLRSVGRPSQTIFSASSEKLGEVRAIARADISAVETVRQKLSPGKKVAIGIVLFFLGLFVFMGVACSNGSCVS